MKKIDMVKDIVSNMKNKPEANKNNSIDDLIHQAKDISGSGQWRAPKKELERILAEAEALGIDKNSKEYQELWFYLNGKAPKSTYF